MGHTSKAKRAYRNRAPRRETHKIQRDKCANVRMVYERMGRYTYVNTTTDTTSPIRIVSPRYIGG